MEEGSEEFLGVSHIVPLPRVVHNDEMSPVPVIINIQKDMGFSVQTDEEKGGSHFGVVLELLHRCYEW